MRTKNVAIVVKNDYKQVLLCRRKKVDKNISKLQVPGGKVDLGETLLQAAVRELFEETGLWVSANELYYFFTDNEASTAYFYLILKGPVTILNKEPNKHTDWTIFSLEQVQNTPANEFIDNLRGILLDH